MTFSPISWCRSFDTTCVRFAAILATILPVFALAGTASANDPESITTVERLVDEAGQAKIEGNLALSYALLHQAVGMRPTIPGPAGSSARSGSMASGSASKKQRVARRPIRGKSNTSIAGKNLARVPTASLHLLAGAARTISTTRPVSIGPACFQ